MHLLFLLAQASPPSIPWYENPAIWTQIGLIVTTIVGFLTMMVQRYLDRAKIDEVDVKVEHAKTERANAKEVTSKRMDELVKKVDENTKITETATAEQKAATNGLVSILVEAKLIEGKAIGGSEERAKQESKDAARLSGVLEGKASATVAAPSAAAPQTVLDAKVSVVEMKVDEMEVDKMSEKKLKKE